MLVIKSVLIVCITLTFINYTNGEYLISGSELDEACSMSARLLSSGLKDDQVEKILFHKLSQFNRKLKPGKKPSLGYAYAADILDRGPVNQSGPINVNIDNFIHGILNLMNCASLYRCLPITRVCPWINYPDQVDFDNSNQINLLVKQIESRKSFAHRCARESIE